MTVLFRLCQSSTACRLHITDAAGKRVVFLAMDFLAPTDACYSVELYGDSAEITAVPIAYAAPQAGAGVKGWLKMQGRRWLAALENAVCFQVGCSYRLDSLQEREEILLKEQTYACTSYTADLVFDLVPVDYLFFEAVRHGKRQTPTAARCTNKRSALKASRTAALLSASDGGFGCLSFLLCLPIFPLQMLRVRFLTRNRRMFRTLARFHRMSEVERQKVLRRNDR
ncbi:MAG: hypothetical protein IJZ13_08460 [Clostridia bacterium]|nr:hypothetical protein [Clostridia bacterium]